MADVNEFANSLLLDFLDEFHRFLKLRLEEVYSVEWFQKGIERHIGNQYLERTRAMLTSPMRVVDMGKEDEELYGVEHLKNVVDGNWASFKEIFGDRDRTKDYLGEMSEIRHNISHRRRKHYIRRDELLRFVQNCSMLLRPINQASSAKFVNTVENLLAGGSPWGPTLGGRLPPHDEVVDEFVGRPLELRRLSEWLAGDMPQFVLWGYGGAGKSATAYKFGQDVQEASPQDLQAVCWVSAKRVEYRGGRPRELVADFHDIGSFCSAVWVSLYGVEPPAGGQSPTTLLNELKTTRVLLIVDDFDTALEDDDLAEFLVFNLRDSGSKILYTSRQQYPGLRGLEIPAFKGDELIDFVRLRAAEYNLDTDFCLSRVGAIENVTGGYPLFVDDLLRYAMVDGVQPALEAWSQRKGDAAREYALRRQLEKLGRGGLDVLMSVSVANRPLQAVEIAQVAGLTDDDVDQAVVDLLRWRLVNHTNGAEGNSAFSVNLNTRRLVQKTYASDARLRGRDTAFRTLRGDRVPEAKRAAIGGAIKLAREKVYGGNIESAAESIVAAMTGELKDSPDLCGSLGWVYSRLPQIYSVEARNAFLQAYQLGAKSEDTFYHWATMEISIIDRMVGQVEDSEVLEGWRQCAQIGEWGVERAGLSDAMCHLVGYARSREAKTLEHIHQFIPAQSAYEQSVDWFRKALDAPYSTVRSIYKGSIYRGLVLGLEGLGDIEEVARELRNWQKVSDQDFNFKTEKERLVRRFPDLVGKV